MIETSTNHSKASVNSIVIDMTDGYSESQHWKQSKTKKNVLAEKPKIRQKSSELERLGVLKTSQKV